MAAVFLPIAKQSNSMKKQNQSAHGRYVSAEKVQQALAQLGIELCAGRKRIRAARSDKSISKKLSAKVCGLKKNPHLCGVHHLIQARRLANIAAGISYVHGITYSSVPCGALMRPQPESGGEQRGAELFLFPLRNNQYIVSF